ncbi:MAG: DUF4406 domain-containing protein [Lachnospiraceae bacterium]|nr:DUF4406 domain-containing protein [bacterium]MDY5518460.1 DUF4406 domain-containing protein [Lachnospiraceae bacterium]
MTRIYLSGPITGNENYTNYFAKAEIEAMELFGGADKVDIINPANLRYVMPKDATWDEYMKVCTELLDMVGSDGIIYMLPGWKTSAGACVEYGFARAIGMAIVKAKGAE